MKYSLTINGENREVTATPEMPLLWVLRDLLGLTGTKFGCGQGICGACTVHQGDEAVRSCQLPMSEASGGTFTTIEGLAQSGQAHPCQRAWMDEDVAQCGYCQPGMIMTAAAMLKQIPRPTDSDIDRTFSNSVCRCGTYQRMRQAIHRAAREMQR
ncbi:MAG: (2Fe-2S)-binding protein [Candidatus Acidiferrales bacterium]